MRGLDLACPTTGNGLDLAVPGAGGLDLGREHHILYNTAPHI